MCTKYDIVRRPNCYIHKESVIKGEQRGWEKQPIRPRRGEFIHSGCNPRCATVLLSDFGPSHTNQIKGILAYDEEHQLCTCFFMPLQQIMVYCVTAKAVSW